MADRTPCGLPGMAGESLYLSIILPGMRMELIKVDFGASKLCLSLTGNEKSPAATFSDTLTTTQECLIFRGVVGAVCFCLHQAGVRVCVLVGLGVCLFLSACVSVSERMCVGGDHRLSVSYMFMSYG